MSGVIYNIGLQNKTKGKSVLKNKLSQGFIKQEGSAATMIISDGNAGPSGASPAHLLCHGVRAYLKPRQFRRADIFRAK